MVSTPEQPLPIRLNGQPYEVPPGTTVAGLVRRLELAQDRVAVEVDRRLVRRRDWDGRRLEASTSVEIVQLVGGG